MDMQSTDRRRLGNLGRKTTIVSVLAVSLLLVLPLAINQSNAYGSNAVWQVGLSQNFNGPGSGQNGGGGFWEWIEFDSSTGSYLTGDSADATLTGCGHAGAGTGLAGATHFNMDITDWYVAPSSMGPFDSFWASGGTVTISGTLENGTKIMQPVTITLDQAVNQGLVTYDSGIPAAPGHYGSYDIFGVRTPGIAIEIQVVQLSH